MRKTIFTAALAWMLAGASGGELVIGDFEKPDSIIQFWTSKEERWGACGAKHEISNLYSTRGGGSMKVSFSGDAGKKTWPYFDFTFRGSNRDLSRWRFFRFDAFVPGGAEVPLRGRFVSLAKDGSERPLWLSFRLKPGMNHLKIRISDGDGATSDPKDAAHAFCWNNVKTLNFYLDAPTEDVTIFVDNIRFDDGTETEAVDPSPRSVSAARFAVPPAIDGKLDESCWKDAPPTPAFLANHNGGTSALETRARIGYDDENLYVGVVCMEPDPSKIRRVQDFRTQLVCADDSIEIFLSNGQRPGEYFQGAANTGKGVWDGAASGETYTGPFESGWKHAAHIDADRWTFEAAIPFSVLRFHGEPQPDWRINIVRNTKTSVSETSALFPTFGTLHAPHKFGTVTGLSPAAGARSLTVEKLTPGKAVPGKNEGVLTVTGFGAGVGGEFRLAVRFGDEPESVTPFILKKGTADYPFRYHLRRAGTFAVTGRIADASGREAARIPEQKAVSAKTVELKFLAPWYKNAIFATQNLPEAELSITLNAGTDALRGAKLRTTLLTEDGKTLQEKEHAAEAGRIVWKFPVGDLACGSYRVSAELSGVSGENLGSESIVLRKLPPHAGEVRMDEKGRILLDGKRFFPICAWYGSQQDNKLKQSAGFNCNWFFGGFRTPRADAETVGKSFQDGMPVTFGIGAATIQQEYFKETPFESVREKLKALVEACRETPGFLAYDLLDEPQSYFSSPLDGWIRAKKMIDELDPYHPSRITQNGENTLSAEYAGVCDLYAFDYYPGYLKGGLSRTPLGTTALRVRELRRILPPYMAVIPLFQAYDRLCDEGQPNGRYSDYREVRLLGYSCVAEGANGLEFWSWGLGQYSRMPDRVEWFGIREAVREFAAMSGVFLGEDAEVSSPDAGKETHFRLKESGGERYLIAANSSVNERKLRFSSEALKGVTHLNVMGEGRSVEVRNGVVEDVFSKYAVHVYTTARTAPYAGNIAENEREEKRILDSFEAANASDLFYTARHAGRLTPVLPEGNFGVTRLNPFDGMKGSAWAPKTGLKPPYVFEVGMGIPETVGRIVLENAHGAPEAVTVDVLSGGKWLRAASGTFPDAPKSELAFPPVKTEKVRITVPSVHGTSYQLENLRAFAK